MMKILIVGLGSMGQRRLRLIKKIVPDAIIFGVVRKPEKRIEIQNKCAIKCFATLEEAFEMQKDINCVFVCSGPLSHAEIIKKSLQNKKHVFTEINLVSDGYDENIALARKNGCKLFLSSTFFYRKEYEYFKCKISAHSTKKLNYHFYTGQYLPNWHPWEDYRKVFFSDVKTNGCREIMAIDLPWIFSLFGKVKNYKYIRGRNTLLDLAPQYMDNCLILLEHESGHKGIIDCNVVSPKTERSIKIYGEQFYMQWNGNVDGLYELFPTGQEENPNKTPLKNVCLYESGGENLNEYASHILEDAYLSEIQAFFDYVKKDASPKYTFEDDFYTVKFMDEIENGNQGGNF